MSRPSRPALQLELIESRITPTVTYHGGALLKNVEAQPVYLGSDWATPALTTTKHDLDTFVNYLVGSPYMDALGTAGYGVGRGVATAGVVAANAVSKNLPLTESSIEAQLQGLIAQNAVAQPTANSLYVLYVAPGVVVQDSQGMTSTADFNGFHGAFLGYGATGRAADVRYAVISYPGVVNPTAISQGFLSTFAALTTYTSHEMAEAITDPDVNYQASGWYDDQFQAEICDLTGQTMQLGGYTVHQFVDKDGNPVGLGGTGSTAGSIAGAGSSTNTGFPSATIGGTTGGTISTAGMGGSGSSTTSGSSSYNPTNGGSTTGSGSMTNGSYMPGTNSETNGSSSSDSGSMGVTVGSGGSSSDGYFTPNDGSMAGSGFDTISAPGTYNGVPTGSTGTGSNTTNGSTTGSTTGTGDVTNTDIYWTASAWYRIVILGLSGQSTDPAPMTNPTTTSDEVSFDGTYDADITTPITTPIPTLLPAPSSTMSSSLHMLTDVLSNPWMGAYVG